MRVCYLIASHTNPAQVVRLVRTIKRGSPSALVLIRHDATRCELDTSPFAGLRGVHLLRGETPVRRADFSALEPYLEGVAWLLAGGHDFDWLVNLSGQDYPTAPLASLESFLAATDCHGFIRHWDVTARQGNPWGQRKGRKRYFCQYRRLPDRALPWLRLARFTESFTPLRFFLIYGPIVGWPARETPFSDDFRCYGGYHWHTLSRACVAYLHDYLAAHPGLVAYYRRTSSPEESLVHTVLANAGRFRLCPDDLRFIDYAGSRTGHPRVLTAADVPTITDGRCFFARKLDPEVDERIFDLLDRRVFGGGAAVP